MAPFNFFADPEQLVIEVEGRRTNNRMDLDVVIA